VRGKEMRVPMEAPKRELMKGQLGRLQALGHGTDFKKSFGQLLKDVTYDIT